MQSEGKECVSDICVYILIANVATLGCLSVFAFVFSRRRNQSGRWNIHLESV